MSFDPGGSTLDIAIGLAFIFFLLSIIVSAVTEGISWRLGMRAKKLEEGLVGMLGTEFADKVLAHPLSKNDLGNTSKGKDPSYISPRNFSMALVELLKKEGGARARDEANEVVPDVPEPASETTGSQEPDSQAKVTAAVKNLGETPLGEQLEALLDEVEGDLSGFRKSAEDWFDDTMDRVAGWYKRWSQVINIGVALVVAISLNASAVRIVERLNSDETVRTAVVAGAQATANSREKSPKATGKAAETAVKELRALKIPILWSHENDPFRDPKFWRIAVAVIGWLITAIAISFGAPFWFDALGKLAHLKTTGKKPEKEPEPAT